MKLKEKFERYVLEKDFFGDNVQEKYTIECEKIADDYAIEFAEWLRLNAIETIRGWQFDGEDYTDTTILEIFKKEK